MDIISIIQAATRGLIAVIVVGGCVYVVITGGQVPTEGWALAGIVVGALFGVEAAAKVARARQNGRKR